MKDSHSDGALALNTVLIDRACYNLEGGFLEEFAGLEGALEKASDLESISGLERFLNGISSSVEFSDIETLDLVKAFDLESTYRM